MPKMDYSKLLGKIKENGHTQKSVAEAIGIRTYPEINDRHV